MDMETHEQFWTRGRGVELAQATNLTVAAISKWKKRGIPPTWVPFVSEQTGFAKGDLNPIFR
jgi:hypothetical protein|tara:strand:- start:59 stop:244 length:186 start_codon:yes stop_codon:yes gene_type:complete